jgi:histidine triad (HIT) family protein
VLPKAAARNLLDAEPGVLAAVMATAQKVARAAMGAFNAGGVLIKLYNEAAAGQTVFHMHVHVIPRHEGQELRPHGGKMADTAVLAKHAEMIRARL